MGLERRWFALFNIAVILVFFMFFILNMYFLFINRRKDLYSSGFSREFEKFNGIVGLNFIDRYIGYLDRVFSGSKVYLVSIDFGEEWKVSERNEAFFFAVVPKIMSFLSLNDFVGIDKKRNLIVCFTNLYSDEDLNLVLQKIKVTLNSGIGIEGKQVVFNPSFGVSVYPDNGRDFETLYMCTNIALSYSDVVLNPISIFGRKKEIINREHLIINELPKSIERGDFRLVYQPQVSLEGENIFAFEALVRWKHPELGDIYPSEFIPVAEKTGLIVDLGYYILRKVCQDYKKLDRNDIKFSVNISGKQLMSEDFLDTVKKILEEEGVPQSSIIVELTESFDMRSIDSVKTVLCDLCFSIAIDDFGVGYSTLSYLMDLKVDYIKIDKSFVNGLTQESNDARSIIFKTIVCLANKLGLKVIVEGVETEEHKEVIKGLRCFGYQGYLFSKPVEFNEIEKLLIAS